VRTRHAGAFKGMQMQDVHGTTATRQVGQLGIRHLPG